MTENLLKGEYKLLKSTQSHAAVGLEYDQKAVRKVGYKVRFYFEF